MKVLLVTPPIIQINTPYPATPYLTSFLRSRGHEVRQKDMGLDLALKIFTREGLERVRRSILGNPNLKRTAAVEFFLEAFRDYQDCVEPVIQFAQRRDESLVPRLAQWQLVPQGPRMVNWRDRQELLQVFGELGDRDKASFVTGLFLLDIVDVVQEGVDERFAYSRYGEQLASSIPSFSPLYKSLKAPPTLIDEMMGELAQEYMSEFSPDLLGLSCPFPGTVAGGLSAARDMRRIKPDLKVVMGGGFVNTELRELSDPRIFEFVDYLTFDDGQRPLELLIEHLSGRRSEDQLLRTMVVCDGKVRMISAPNEKDIPFKSIPAPTYDGLRLGDYLSAYAIPNPMQRLWTDFRWLKMILAHGCYWKRCTFCDINLDYIQRFEPARVDQLIENIKALIAETGVRGFHFVDEAAPPALLKALSQRLIDEGIKISWWTNIRFDPQFTPEMAQLMADAGCIAVTGGLEIGSPRLLELMQKGISVEQVARVTKAFSQSGILVHAYLIYGFPTQTDKETVESLEVVRQLFAEGCIQSGFWHQFSLTAHSPIARELDKYKLKLAPYPTPEEGLFSRNSLPYYDDDPDKITAIGEGLKLAVFNYLQGVGFNRDVREWFSCKMPKSTIPRTLIRRAISQPPAEGGRSAPPAAGGSKTKPLAHHDRPQS